MRLEQLDTDLSLMKQERNRIRLAGVGACYADKMKLGDLLDDISRLEDRVKTIEQKLPSEARK